MRKSEIIIMIESSRVVLRYLGMKCLLSKKNPSFTRENVESLNLMQTYLNIIRTKMNNFPFFYTHASLKILLEFLAHLGSFA